MPIQFACSCGEPLCFADDQCGGPAACPRCGLALTVPRLGLLVGAGPRLPPAAQRAPAGGAVPVAAPFAPPPAPVPVRRRRFPWLAAAALLLLAGGSLRLLFPSKDRLPEPRTEEKAPPAEEVSFPSIAQVGPRAAGQPSQQEVAISPIDAPPRPAAAGDAVPGADPAPDPLQLQRLRAEKNATGPLTRDLRRELRLLRAEQAERRPEAQQLHRELERLRAEMSADAVRSVEEAIAGGPGETPFDRLAARGRAALAERDYEIAVRELTRAAALEPSDPDVRALLAAARAGLDKVNEEVPEALKKAKDALFAGDVQAAKNIYAVLLLVAPKDRRVRDAVARLQARIAKGEIPTGESRWLTAEEIEALHDRPPPPSFDWHLGGVNPEITARAIAYGQVYRTGAEQQTARGRAAGGERTAALRGKPTAPRAGQEHDAGADEEGMRMRLAWHAGVEGLAEDSARSSRAGREARVAWDAQDARLAHIGRELEGLWRQQDQRAHGAAAGQMLGLLQQHGRIAEAIRQHNVLAREQGARMAAGGGAGAWAEQGDRAGRAGRDLDAGLRLLIGRAEQAGRRFDAGLRAQDERGRAARHEAGGGEVGDRFRAGARAGRDNLAGEDGRFARGRPNPEADERARDAARRLNARELEDRILWGLRDQRVAVETRHGAEPPAPRESEPPPPPPRADDPADTQKERDEAERALAERNRKAHAAAEMHRLLAERDQRRRDLDELKKLVAEKEAQQRDADELTLLRAEKERLRRLREGLKELAQDPKKE